MTEEEQSITILRKRRRNSANGSHNGTNGTNGHARNGHDWGWTRPNEEENPFARDTRESSRRREEFHEPEEKPRRRLSYNGPSTAPEPPKDAIKLPFDPWRLLSAVKHRWSWLLIGTILLGGLGYFAGTKLAKYKVSVGLIRRQVDNAMAGGAAEARPPMLSDQTIFAFMRSGGIIQRVVDRAASNNPPIRISAPDLAKAVSITPTPLPDIIALSLSSEKFSPELATVLNIYAEEVVRYTREIQASESGDVSTLLAQQLAIADKEFNEAQNEFLAFQKEAGLNVAIDKEAENYLRQITDYDTRLQAARIDAEVYQQQIVGVEKLMATQGPVDDEFKLAVKELARLKIEYTDIHPDVIRQQRIVDALEKQKATPNGTPGVVMTANSFGNALYLQKMEYQAKRTTATNQIAEFQRLKEAADKRLSGLSEKSIKYAQLESRVKSLKATRELLAQKQRDAGLFVDNAMGLYRVYGQASDKDINWKNRAIKVLAVTGMGAAMGLIAAILLAFVCEASDTRLKTVADIERATKLPVLATLGDLKKMNPNEQINWAFRTLTLLRGKLCQTSDDALVCGFISSRNGEGRSTWVNLLVSAASQRGLRVLTVDTRPTAEGPKTEPRPPQYPAGAATSAPKKDSAPPKSAAQNEEETAAANDLLAKPMAVAERLKDPESIVHIPIPGWVWSLDRRQQWQEALAAWREIDNTVILIELPPASHPEAILLAEKIPQLIWLTGSGMADVKETREQLETLRHAHCNVVGAALNFEPPPPMNTKLGRWFNWATKMIIIGFGLCGSIQAQDNATNAANASFSAAAQPKRAKWQERLTLGPGDTMDISLFGQTNSMRTNIFVGPDGRISYMQAQGVVANGLTVEELRERLDQELAKYFKTAPRSIVIPTAFNSKKYYVLGKVNNKGSYSLDRPLTVVEAVARAQGLETGLYERTTVEMADLSRSFLIRNNTREKVDFEKLFLEGDLSQNITIEPDDFLYFAGAGAREIYVLGEVLNPGPIGFVSDATVLTAITDRSGFTDRAYKGKVLVVRGSLNKPETFIVDTKEILNAAKPDFKLESRDIIYVSRRPWSRAEELLDEATQSFIQGFVTAFTGVKIGPWIKNPIFGD